MRTIKPTKINTTRQRLALYKKMLQDFDSNSFSTQNGFCYYLYNLDLSLSMYEEDNERYGKTRLPELTRYKPSLAYAEAGSYWFAPGYECNKIGIKNPRIRLLKKAIRYTEKLILKGKK